MILAAEVWLMIATFLDHVQASNSIRPAYNEALDNGTYGPYPVKTFMSEDSFASPQMNFVQWSPECEDGMYYFITPRGRSLPDPSPMIIDTDGELVWTQYFDNPFGGQVYDFKVQQYQGQDYLTFWTGDDSLNSSYDIIHEIKASDGFSADLHEFTITDRGTALMTIYDRTSHDLTGFREFNATANPDDEFPNYIWDCLIQEFSIHTGKTLFQWRSSEHINITDSFREINLDGTQEVPWDWFHVNSIYKDEIGNYLISARYTHSLTYIDGKTSEVLWVLGGKRNEFMDLSNGSVLNFAWQHDAEFHSLDAFPEIYTPKQDRPGFTTKLLTVFDNAAADSMLDYGPDHSRGLLLEITFPTHRAGNASDRWTNGVKQGLFDREAKDEEKLYFINGTDPDFTVRLIQTYENPRKVRSSSQGSMQVLPGAEDARTKVFVGYGSNAVFTEFDINGTTLCDVHFSAQSAWEESLIQSYRAFKFAWTGTPTWSPRIEISDDDVEVFLSWNGATEVKEWLLQGSNIDDEFDGNHWADILRFEKRGFETSIELPKFANAERRYLRALALDKNGEVLDFGTTDLLDREPESDIDDLEVNLPKQIERHPARSYVLLLLGIFLTVCGYELLRKGFSWYNGQSTAGPIRWKKGSQYIRLRSEV
ncbi:hypothetical protein MRB53_041163 [Persea americana]|nr:hypothetical protein MRB53_041163 [Persea americana]